MSTNDASIDALIKKFYTETVGLYWDAERKYVDDNYNSLPFNFTPLPSAAFFIKAMWGKDDLIGYLNSWSSVQHFIAAKNYNPVNDIINDLGLLWKNEKPVSFPLFLEMGRVE